MKMSMRRIMSALGAASGLALTTAAFTTASYAGGTAGFAISGAAVANVADSSTSVGTLALDDTPYFEGANYDPAVPTIKSVLGYNSGERITRPEDMVRYMEALAAFAPERVKLMSYGQSWENRKLIYLAISSPKNIAALDDISANMRKIADPRSTTAAEAEALMAGMPASIWLSYSVHGNEISSTDAAMMTAYHLLASRGDARVPKMMDDTVVFINPLQNPDGRARFVARFETATGNMPSAEPLSAEHNEPWPNGRTNHYLFDMNRDWITLTQPEISGQVGALQKHYPLVFIDLHEMGGNSSYYFAPEAVPFNPHLTPEQRSSLFWFGKNNAKWFDKIGRSYFTRDIFDAFYPGYGASWPAYYGAIAMTYEQSSSRGLAYRRYDGSEFTYRDTVKGHFTTSLASIETAADNRAALLANFRNYQESAIEAGSKDRSARYRVWSAGGDRAAAAKMAANLAKMGVEVMHGTPQGSVCGVAGSEGLYAIDTAQPRARMVRTLLDQQVDMDIDFVKAQEELRGRDESHDIYDITGWALPVLYNLDVKSCGKASLSGLSALGADFALSGGVTGSADSVVFLAPWGDGASAKLLAAALKAGVYVNSHETGFTLEGKDYPRGTLIFPAAENGPELFATLNTLAQQTGAQVVGTSTSWVDKGRDLGSRSVIRMLPVKIAMAWDEPTSSSSAGNTRFVIEQQLGYPVTPIRLNTLARSAPFGGLDRFDVLILPNAFGSYGQALDERGQKALTDWVRAGGTLIAQSNAVRFLSEGGLDLIASKPENTPESTAPSSAPAAGSILTSADALRAAITPTSEKPDSLPGVLVKADLNADHYLSAGVKSSVNVMATGSDIYAPLKLDAGRNVASFAGPEDILASGYIWEENRKQMAYKPFVMATEAGYGTVIAYTQEPTFRASMDGLLVLYANSLFRPAGHSNKQR